MEGFVQVSVAMPAEWDDYALLDTGDGKKLERFGRYTFVRPESQALWTPRLATARWEAADAVFEAATQDERGHWTYRRAIEPRWEMRRGPLRFWVQPTPFRHLGVFPEQAGQWDWMAERIRTTEADVTVLNLFGYTGLASLAAAHAGARVTHVDASKQAIAWARENQTLSDVDTRAIRWLVDDASKFVAREVRRGSRYDGIILDPPKFGRGPKGEVWKLHEALPPLLALCRDLLSPRALFLLLNSYAADMTATSLYYVLDDKLAGLDGQISAGELMLREQSGERRLSLGSYAQWSRD